MIGIALAAALASATIPYNAQDEAAARAWIARAGHRFNPAANGPADLAPIVSRIAGARVIGIGEATHGTQQDEAFKAELIKALVRAGAIDTLAIECNRAAGYGFDRYVQYGEGDPAALMRSRSFFSIWRNDAFGGLLLWLRGWNQSTTKPIRIIGIDNQDSSTDAAVALDFLARHDADAAQRLRAAMQGLLSGADGAQVALHSWISNADRAAYDAMFAAAVTLENALSNAPSGWRDDPLYAEASYAAAVARQGLFEYSGEYKGADASKLGPEYYTLRDKFMAANLVARLGQQRAALWAHDGHVANATSLVEEKQGYYSLGWFLKSSLGAAYRAVGFTWSRATLRVVSLPETAPNPPRDARVYSHVPLRNDRPGTFGHVFDPLPGDAWWIDLRARPHTAALDRWGARYIWRGWSGWRVDPANWQIAAPDATPTPPDRGFDVLVWFRTMSPAQTWPDVPAKH